MTSGLYITKNNIKHNRADKAGFQKIIQRRISAIFNILIELGLCESHGKNTLKIDREKLKTYSLSDIMSHTIKV